MYKYVCLAISLVAISGCNKSDSTAAPQVSSDAQAVTAPRVDQPTPTPKVEKGPWQGPFGLKMGLTDAQLAAAMPDYKTAADNISSTIAPPKPHEAFENYYLLSSASQGLCKVSGIGKTIKTSQFGDELRNAHNTLKEALIEKYGKPTGDMNFLKSGSIWSESQYWMMGLLKKDRILTAYWQKKSEKKPKGVELPNDIESIVIDTVAEGTESGYVTVRYAFTNESDCIDELKKESNKAL